ncbi:MAG TPA: pectinesterase family protein [Bacillota bacterium]|nr:pectinesterase family protein [Bacillota bacterium]
MKKFRKMTLSVIAVLMIAALVAGCGGGSKKKKIDVGQPDTSSAIGLVLDQASMFNDDLNNANNWEFLNGFTGQVVNGVLIVNPAKDENGNFKNTEGLAIKLKDSVWQQLGKPTSYYVEMLVRPRSLPQGNKNIGIATYKVSGDTYSWVYAGFNSNGRMQAGYYAGDTATLKGYQNSNDGTKLTENELVYYKWRYEYNNGVVNFYSNDLYMGKNDGTGYMGKAIANYNSGQQYNDGIGFYSCGAAFEIDSVRIGKIDENQTKLVISTSNATLPRLWAKHLSLLKNTASSAIRVGDEVEFTVTAFNASGAADTWVAESSNPNVLTVSPASGNSGEVLKVTAVGMGTAAITVKNGSNANSKRQIIFSVDKKLDYVDDDYTGIDKMVYPNAGAAAVHADGELSITFDSAPQIMVSTGEVSIYEYETNTLVDTIRFTNDTYVIADRGTADMNVGSQRIRIDGNKLYIAPHPGKLAYNTKYYVAIKDGLISGKLNGKDFTGFSPSKKTWNFTTKAEPVISNGDTVTVDGKEGSKAMFRTVQAALDAATKYNNLTIEIAPGTYYELLTYKKDYNVTLKGMGSAKYGRDVVIRYANGEKANSGTQMRPLAYMASSGTITLVNLTLQNDGKKATYAQAETIYFNRDSGHLVAKNCSFISEQDTILTKGYNWFKDCYIEGSTDFIWGYAVVSLFENCEIKCIESGSIIAHARCTQDAKGYVFLNCQIETTGTSFLARDMSGTESNYDNITYVNCTITGNGTLDWANDFQPTPHGQASALTGWKYYNLKDGSGNPYILKSDWDYELTQAEYEAGFASKELILGKPTSSGGAWVDTNAWNPVEP